MFFFFFQAEDGIRVHCVTGVQTCALPIFDADPLRQFERWYEEAGEVVEFPEAVALATATAGGSPSVRMVLAKSYGHGGFKFHTGHGSRKARELAENARGALVFYWAQLGRQVR